MPNTEYTYNNHLRELNTSDFEMVNGEPDIRNWRVIGLHNQEVGKIKELLFDEVSHRVRYVIVDLNGKPLNILSRAVLIPVGLVELLKDEKIAIVSGLTVGHLASLPTYESGKVTSVTEHAVRNVFAPNAPVYESEDRSGFYNHEHFNDDRFYRPNTELREKKMRENEVLREEMRGNIERVKESVKKMENDLEKLEKSSL